MVAGSASPLSSIINAVGSASAVLVNQNIADVAVLPSAAFVKGDKTVVVLNASNEVVAAGIKSGASLYGQFANAVALNAVGAVWNGCVLDASNPVYGSALPPLKLSAGYLHAHSPDNLTFPANKLVLFDEKSTSGGSTGKDALTTTLNKLTDEKKSAIAQKLAENTSFEVISNASQIANAFK